MANLLYRQHSCDNYGIWKCTMTSDISKACLVNDPQNNDKGEHKPSISLRAIRQKIQLPHISKILPVVRK